YPLARALLHGEVVRQAEVLYRRGDGTLTVFSVNAAPVRDASGSIVAAINTFYDISPQKQAQERLQAARQAAEHAAERLARLQAVTAALARAAEPRQVAGAVVEHGRLALGARTASVMVLDEVRTSLEPLQTAGTPDA